jgi:hypothetical protein
LRESKRVGLTGIRSSEPGFGAPGSIGRDTTISRGLSCVISDSLPIANFAAPREFMGYNTSIDRTTAASSNSRI